MKEKWIKNFNDYTNNFDMENHDINLKYHHSLRVANLAEMIAKEENFSEKDIELSYLIGLLHDYARFPQLRDYKTYSDLKSIDHGNLGAELLFDNNEIEKFNINKEYNDEIYDAIKYHNKMSIKDNLSIHNNKLCKMIRDADKLDIFYLYCTDKKVFEEDDKPISEIAKKTFYDNEQISYKCIKSKNDKIVLDFALVFDINYKTSFRYIKEKKLMEKMYDNLRDKELFKEYYNYILKYIDERVD